MLYIHTYVQHAMKLFQGWLDGSEDEALTVQSRQSEFNAQIPHKDGGRAVLRVRGGDTHLLP